MININPGLKKILTISMTRPKNDPWVCKTQSNMEVCSCGKKTTIFLRSPSNSFIVSFCDECWLKNDEQSTIHGCIPISKEEAMVYTIMWI